MNKEERMRQALDDMFKPDERQTEKLSHLLDKMTGTLPIEERIVRFRNLLKECRNGSTEIMRTLTEMGETSGMNLLSIRELLDETIRLSEYVNLRKETRNQQD